MTLSQFTGITTVIPRRFTSKHMNVAEAKYWIPLWIWCISAHNRCWFFNKMKSNLLDHRSLTMQVLYNARSFEYLMHVFSERGEKAKALIFMQVTSTSTKSFAWLDILVCLLLNCKGSVCVSKDVKTNFFQKFVLDV